MFDDLKKDDSGLVVAWLHITVAFITAIFFFVILGVAIDHFYVFMHSNPDLYTSRDTEVMGILYNNYEFLLVGILLILFYYAYNYAMVDKGE